jgi:putative transposase
MNRDEISKDYWPTVFVENMEEEKKKIFLNRKNAIDAVIEGVKTVEEICERYNMIRSEIYRLLDRCLTLNEQGLPYGYVAIIPYKRLNMYQRTEQINGFEEENVIVSLTGAFKKLLMLHPQLDELIKNLVFPKRKGDLESTYKRPKDIHKKFIEECKKLKISPEKGEYPFNTKDIAKRAVYRYIKLLKEINPKSAVKDFGESATTLFNTTGIGDKNIIVERPFERVEFDGHKLDITLAIRYTTLEGDDVVQEIDRIWILAIIDCASTVILGYHICLDREYSTLDILTCYKKAIFPHQAPEFTITGLNIPESGFHSQKIPEAKFAIWDEISLDNAKANRSKLLKGKTKCILDARLNYGPVGTPTRRPFIEKFFIYWRKMGFIVQ